MGWRKNELAVFGPEVTWLDEAESLGVYQRACGISSKTRYGLNEAAFTNIERLNVEDSESRARIWLADRIGDGDERLLLVFSKDDVCVVRTSFFQEQWQDLFCPSRDDVFVLPVNGNWALFYWHEDEFELARDSPA